MSGCVTSYILNWNSQCSIVLRTKRTKSKSSNSAWLSRIHQVISGGGPRVVVSTAAFHVRVRGSVPGLGGLKETKLFLPHPRVKVSIVGSLRDREVAYSASDRQGLNFESCVWRTVSSQSSHHPQEVLLAQFSLYVHKGGLKPDSFHFISFTSSYFSWMMLFAALWWCSLTFDEEETLWMQTSVTQHIAYSVGELTE